MPRSRLEFQLLGLQHGQEPKGFTSMSRTYNEHYQQCCLDSTTIKFGVGGWGGRFIVFNLWLFSVLLGRLPFKSRKYVSYFSQRIPSKILGGMQTYWHTIQPLLKTQKTKQIAREAKILFPFALAERECRAALGNCAWFQLAATRSGEKYTGKVALPYRKDLAEKWIALWLKYSFFLNDQ